MNAWILSCPGKVVGPLVRFVFRFFYSSSGSSSVDQDTTSDYNKVFHECRRSKAGYLFCRDTSQQFQAESLCSDSLFWVNLGVQVLVKHLLHLTFFFCTLGVVNSEISKLLARKASTSSSFWICCCSSDVQYTSTSPDFSTVSKVSDWSLEGTGPTSCFSDFPWPYSPYHFTNKIHTYFIV